MPWKPKTICNYPGCNNLSHGRYCEDHTKQVNREFNKDKAKIYTYQWRKSSKAYLKKNPLCVQCDKEGRVRTATEVDHIIPHDGSKDLFWDRDNWQSLCKSCHSRKTAKENLGFGNPSSIR